MWSGNDRTGIANLENIARAKTALALRQEGAGERKQRLIRDEKGIAILSLSRTKRGLEKATKYRNSQRPVYNITAWCHRIQNLKKIRSSSKEVVRSANCLPPYQCRVQPVNKVFTFERSLYTTLSPTPTEGIN